MFDFLTAVLSYLSAGKIFEIVKKSSKLSEIYDNGTWVRLKKYKKPDLNK